MAEARREEEAEELRDIRNRNQATDRTERKSEALHSSQGPLSSIRAAIKRTRTSTQSEQTRDRRRPEITILSAEPLAANGWFPGASGGFTAAPPPSQPVWGGSFQSDTQPPPSYDQVIKEKTQETIVTPTAAPRRSTTIATQTDPVEDDTTAGPEGTASSQPIEKRQSTVKIKPKKPPRPYLPKPLQSDSTTATAVSDSGLIQVDTTNTKNQTDPKSVAAQPSPRDPSCAIPNTQSLSPSVSVQLDGQIKPSEPSTITTFLEPTVPVATERPIPLPRSKSCKQTITEEVKVQTLVRLSDSGSSSVDVTAVEAPPSGKYLQELLDVFCPVDQFDQNTSDASDNQTPTDRSDQSEEGDEDGDMAALHSQRNIRARIQAFESQEGDGEPEFKQPEPLPRNTHLKPPVISAKPAPALAPKPSIKKPSNGNNYQGAISIFSTPFIPSIPTPAPRPMLHRKPSIVPEPKEQEPEAPPPAKTAILSRSRLSIAARAKNLFPHEEDEPRLVPPISPEKPRKEPLGLNLNNHNSASTTEAVNEYMDNPTNYIPVNPVRSDVGGGGSFSRQTVTRRPTTIRVPSKGNLFDGTLDNPPLPAQKPVGSLPSPMTRKQSISTRFPFQESFDSEPIPGLPPRPGGAKVLPPRPPPAKVGPGRPPPPRINGPRQSLSTRRAPASSAAPSPKQPQAQKPKKGPVLPPRPNPGHRLYNQYTLGLPHGIAEFDYSGRDTGELSFQKNELLLLIEQLDHKTFECQVGDIRGRVQKSHMKVITPLSSAPTKPALSQGVSTVGYRRGTSGLQVQVLHDFTPEGPGELGLREGDVVTNVEQVDSEWYRGSCRGSSGFFPVSYVKVMSNAPTPTNAKKARPLPATVSGPRCVARFDFEGEQSDELTFSEGDVIQLKEYMEEEWARGQIGAHTGIFPINFVDIIEDLPPLSQPQRQQSFPTKMALSGMVSSTKTQEAKPIQSGSSGVVWAVALYDFVGQAEEELSFQQGDRILVTQHVDAEWCSGRLNGREGFFPTAFVEASSGNSPVLDRQQSVTNGEGSRGEALFDFTPECDEELSLKVGDIITNLESIDDEWFLGELRGKRALVPKNYMQVLA